MVILAIDPGINTGIVALDGQGITLAVQVSASVILETGLMENILTSISPSLVAIEAIPTNATNSQLSVQVYYRVLDLTAERYTLKLVNPGLWKPVTGKLKPAIGEHIKDAYGLAQYCFRKESK